MSKLHQNIIELWPWQHNANYYISLKFVTLPSNLKNDKLKASYSIKGGLQGIWKPHSKISCLKHLLIICNAELSAGPNLRLHKANLVYSEETKKFQSKLSLNSRQNPIVINPFELSYSWALWETSPTLCSRRWLNIIMSQGNHCMDKLTQNACTMVPKDSDITKLQ